MLVMPDVIKFFTTDVQNLAKGNKTLEDFVKLFALFVIEYRQDKDTFIVHLDMVNSDGMAEFIFTYDETDHQVNFSKANSRFGDVNANTAFFTRGGFGAVETLCMKIIEGMEDL